MRNAIRLCLKDFSHLWPYVASLWFVVVLRAVTDILLPNHAWLLFLHQNIIPIATYLSCFLITALAVHDDPLTGDRQFWLTRPISWKDLLTGKILFLICTINAPILIAQSAAMLGIGISPLHRLPVLAEQQLTLLVFFAIVAVFASVTRTLAQLMILALAAGVVWLATQIVLEPMHIGYWGSAQNMLFWINNIPLALIALFLLWLQYFRRAARCMIAIIFILLIIGVSFGDSVFAHFWHSAARYRAQQEGVLRNQSPIKVSFQGSPAHHYKGAVGNGTGRDVASFILPVQVTGIPEGYGLISERMNVTVIAPDGSTWESGWTEFSQLWVPSSPPVILLANGNYNMQSNVAGEFYQRIQNTAVRVRVSLAFRLVGPPAPVMMQQDRLSPILNGDGLCGPPQDQSILPVCLFNKFPSAVFFYKNFSIVPLRDSEGGTSIWRYRTTPIYSSVNFRQADSLPQPSEDQLSVRQEEAWFETILDIPQINLSDYLSARFVK